MKLGLDNFITYSCSTSSAQQLHVQAMPSKPIIGSLYLDKRITILQKIRRDPYHRPIYRSRKNLERRIQFQVPTHRMGTKTQSRYRICTDRDHRRPRQQPRIPIASPARRYIRWDRNRILQKRIAAKCSTHSAQPNPQRQKLSAIGISHSGEWE